MKNFKLAPCNYCHRKPGFYSEGINYCWKHWYIKSEKKLSVNNYVIDDKNDNKNNIKEQYERLLLKSKYEEEREEYEVKRYVEDGGEPWDIAPEKYWFDYNKCKNLQCQLDGVDWYKNKFYCDDECEKEAKINIKQIYKTKNTFEKKIINDHIKII